MWLQGGADEDGGDCADPLAIAASSSTGPTTSIGRCSARRRQRSDQRARPPRRAALPVCMAHDRPSFRCKACSASRQFGGPTAPLRFYSAMKMTIMAKTPEGDEIPSELGFTVQAGASSLFFFSLSFSRPPHWAAPCSQ